MTNNQPKVRPATGAVSPTEENVKPIPKIQDSGNRRQFESGAVRDIQKGKGRCDLMPFDIIAECYEHQFGKDDNAALVFGSIYHFARSGNPSHLYDILSINEPFEDYADMFLEVSKHFEEGADKYGENNWQKGIPVKCYIDSAIRHYLKFQRGDKDEPHDRAFCWNIICAIWTCKHKPELNGYLKSVDKVLAEKDQYSDNYTVSL